MPSSLKVCENTCCILISYDDKSKSCRNSPVVLITTSLSSCYMAKSDRRHDGIISYLYQSSILDYVLIVAVQSGNRSAAAVECSTNATKENATENDNVN